METLKDNFYLHVNKQLIEETEIPADKPSVGTFSKIHDQNEEILLKLFQDWSEGKNIPEDKLIHEAIKYHKLVTDFEYRNEIGAKPVLPLIKKIQRLSSIEELAAAYPELELNSIALPVTIGISQSFADPTKHILVVDHANTIMPDREYYEKNLEQLEENLAVFAESAKTVLKSAGLDDSLVDKYVKETLKFDKFLAPFTSSRLEDAEYDKKFNPTPLKEIDAKSKYLNFSQIFKTLTKVDADIVNIAYPRFFENLNTVFSKENFELIKSWMIVKTALGNARYFSEELADVAGALRRKLVGQKQPQPSAKKALYTTLAFFDEPVGIYFGKKYFGEQGKADVLEMIRRFIAVYTDRLSKNTWLSKETREKAILKLSKIKPFVGYPDEIPPYYQDFKIKTKAEGETLVSATICLKRLMTAYEYAQYKEPVNTKYWGMTAYEVNAYFHPLFNQIVFPAGILQPPFYSKENSNSANYGGIGTVIAHEISHAFDNNGAKFDEHGRLNNWWTEADLAAFEEKKKQMIKLFDGHSNLLGVKCNGTLTVSENIADCGGLSCALSALKMDETVDLDAFFKSWATNWFNKARVEYYQMLANVDVHATGELRANRQLANLDEFIEYYGIKEGDQMYTKPEERVKIW